jgi:hypothetical protein
MKIKISILNEFNFEISTYITDLDSYELLNKHNIPVQDKIDEMIHKVYFNQVSENNQTEEKVLVLKKAEDFQKDTVSFSMDKNRNEILKLCPNGDIFVKGRLAENDKQVVDAFKEWLNSQSFSI